MIRHLLPLVEELRRIDAAFGIVAEHHQSDVFLAREMGGLVPIQEQAAGEPCEITSPSTTEPGFRGAVQVASLDLLRARQRGQLAMFGASARLGGRSGFQRYRIGRGLHDRSLRIRASKDRVEVFILGGRAGAVLNECCMAAAHGRRHGPRVKCVQDCVLDGGETALVFTLRNSMLSPRYPLSILALCALLANVSPGRAAWTRVRSITVEGTEAAEGLTGQWRATYDIAQGRFVQRSDFGVFLL
jgi:hypothetical protein